MNTNRPILTVPQTPVSKILEAVAIAGLVALFAVAIQAWLALPDHFPKHFGFDGKPNDWGDKSSLLWLPGLGLFTYLLFSVLIRFPHTFNYLVKITEANALKQYQIAVAMLNWLKAEVVWIYAYTEWQIMVLATASNPSLGLWFLPIVLIVVFGTVSYWLRRSFLAK